MRHVTVLMPVHNGEAHLRAAIDSILHQTHRNFELLVVDDKSTDHSCDIVSSYRDDRIRLIRMDRKVGLSGALNEGLRLARAPIVARQDADDIAEPVRLERQLAVMTARGDLALLGSRATAMSETGLATGQVWRPLEPASIRWYSVFDNPFIHASVMFRAEVVRTLGGFNDSFDPFSQDYDLWCRIMEHHAVANMPDSLIRYRVSDASIIGSLAAATSRAEYQQRFHRIISDITAAQARRVFGDSIKDEEIALVAGLSLGVPPTSVTIFLKLFERLLGLYGDRHDVHSDDFKRTLAQQFDALAFRVYPASRRSAFLIFLHLLRRHPSLLDNISWPRLLTTMLFGKKGRVRVGSWKRRYVPGVM